MSPSTVVSVFIGIFPVSHNTSKILLEASKPLTEIDLKIFFIGPFNIGRYLELYSSKLIYRIPQLMTLDSNWKAQTKSLTTLKHIKVLNFHLGFENLTRIAPKYVHRKAK